MSRASAISHSVFRVLSPPTCPCLVGRLGDTARNVLGVFQRGRPTVPGGESGETSVINGTTGDKTRNKQAHGVIWGSQFRLTGLGQLSAMPTLAHRKVQPSRWRLFPRPVTWTWPEPYREKLPTEPEGDCFIPTAGGDKLRVTR